MGRLKDLQVDLVRLQGAVKARGERVLILIEGRDASGKGGLIKRLTKPLNPRGCRVVALDRATERERGQWYFQRYLQHLPHAGEIVVFDRSWYNRAGLEHVNGFCSPAEYAAFLKTAPELEAMLVRDGLVLRKLYFEVSKEEQAKRLEKRRKDPLVQWKLSALDELATAKYDDYTRAADAMFEKTRPWTIVHGDDKQGARLNAIRWLLSTFAYEGKSDLALDPGYIEVRT